MDIQWYPGHMAKAKRLLTDELKKIDVVAELVDARAPLATRNPDFEHMFRDKARVVLLNKCDLADPAATAAWVAYYRARSFQAQEIVSTAPSCRKKVVSLIEKAGEPSVIRMRQKGVTKVLRAMIVGIPNVGKSTLINRIAGQKRALTGDKPGVTRASQWVRITPYLELLDTPGLLWPKLSDQNAAAHLAYIGSVRDEITDAEQLASGLLSELLSIVPERVSARYPGLVPGLSKDEVLAAVCAGRGFLRAGGAYDTDRAARVVLDEFRGGRIGCVTLEWPERTPGELP